MSRAKSFSVWKFNMGRGELRKVKLPT